jgi:hypothetical protein
MCYFCSFFQCVNLASLRGFSDGCLHGGDSVCLSDVHCEWLAIVARNADQNAKEESVWVRGCIFNFCAQFVV